jgi:hypothetical protein
VCVFPQIKLLSQDKRHADILGFVLPWDVKNMFICEEDADVDLLLTEMIGRENIKVPIKKMSRQSRLSLQDPEAFRQYVDPFLGVTSVNVHPFFQTSRMSDSCF